MSCGGHWLGRRSCRCCGRCRLDSRGSYASLRRGGSWRRGLHPRCSCGRFLRFFLGFGGRLRLSFGFSYSLNLLANFFGDVSGN